MHAAIAFGPVPSRRLGQSLGVNNIPPKTCSYSCIYCQVGRTNRMSAERRAFYDPESILGAVQRRVEQTREAGQALDYITFVADGEPTLDISLGREIELLATLGVKIAVISNASLIWREDVRAELAKASTVSLKVDSTVERIWRRVNRPARSLRLTTILEGMLAFAAMYRGRLITETMLVRDVNDDAEGVREVGDFLARLRPACAYLSVPTRPPAEPWAQVPDARSIAQAYQIVGEKAQRVEYLIGYEGNAFASTGRPAEDLLSISAVHPLREEAVCELLNRVGADWAVVDGLIASGQLVETEYRGCRFYMRRLKSAAEGRSDGDKEGAASRR